MNSMTLEEFTDIVKKTFAIEWKKLSKEKVDAYFEEDETKEIVKEEYNWGIKDIESGKITENVFRNGVAGSVAHCLALMY